MGGERGMTRMGGRCGKHLAGFPAVPVPACRPAGRLVGVSPPCPGAELHPGETI